MTSRRGVAVRVACIVAALVPVGVVAVGAVGDDDVDPAVEVTSVAATAQVPTGGAPLIVTHEAVFASGEEALKGEAIAAPTRTIASPIATGFTNKVAPVDGGASLLYSSWEHLGDVREPGELRTVTGEERGVPSVRKVDLATGRDVEVMRGANGFAVSASGQVAVIDGDEDVQVASRPYTGRVSIIGEDGRPRALTGSGYYQLIGWAGDDILFSEGGEGGSGDLLAVAEGEDARRIAGASEVVAISPDGTKVLVQQRETNVAGVAVIDIATRRAIGEPGVLQGPNGPLTPLTTGGDWVGTTVVATTAVGYVRLDMSSGAPKVVRVHDVDLRDLPWALQRVALTPDGGVVGTALVRPIGAEDVSEVGSAILTCDTRDRCSTQHLSSVFIDLATNHGSK